jgi:hypothetical protein
MYTVRIHSPKVIVWSAGRELSFAAREVEFLPRDLFRVDLAHRRFVTDDSRAMVAFFLFHDRVGEINVIADLPGAGRCKHQSSLLIAGSSACHGHASKESNFFPTSEFAQIAHVARWNFDPEELGRRGPRRRPGPSRIMAA